MNLLSWELAHKLDVTAHELPVPLEAKGIDSGNLFGVSYITDLVETPFRIMQKEGPFTLLT